MTHYFSQSGPASTAQSRAMGYIGRLVHQATLLAYIDIFYTWAVFAALLVPVVLLLIRRVKPGRAGAAVGH